MQSYPKRVDDLVEEFGRKLRKGFAYALTEFMAREPRMSVELRDETIDIINNLDPEIDDIRRAQTTRESFKQTDVDPL